LGHPAMRLSAGAEPRARSIHSAWRGIGLSAPCVGGAAPRGGGPSSAHRAAWHDRRSPVECRRWRGMRMLVAWRRRGLTRPGRAALTRPGLALRRGAGLGRRGAVRLGRRGPRGRPVRTTMAARRAARPRRWTGWSLAVAGGLGPAALERRGAAAPPWSGAAPLRLTGHLLDRRVGHRWGAWGRPDRRGASLERRGWVGGSRTRSSGRRRFWLGRPVSSRWSAWGLQVRRGGRPGLRRSAGGPRMSCSWTTAGCSVGVTGAGLGCGRGKAPGWGFAEAWGPRCRQASRSCRLLVIWCMCGC
jgi:hypothetical protein